MKIYMVVQCDAKVNYYIDRIELYKTKAKAMEIVYDMMGGVKYVEENQSGRIVWVSPGTIDVGLKDQDCMIYIQEREVQE